jgi:hypothetical protein
MPYKEIEKRREMSRKREKVRYHERYSRDDSSLIRFHSRNLLRLAVACGRVVRPDVCSICGGKGARIEGHHVDYLKPLEVVWLCSECHGKERGKGRV